MEFPDDGTKPDGRRYFPPVGSSRFACSPSHLMGALGCPRIFDIEAALAELEQNLPGLAEYVESENPGMQTTAIID